MAGPSACRASGSPRYSATQVARLRRRVSLAALLLACGFCASGCAISNSLFGGSGRDDAGAYAKADTTGSIAKASDSMPSDTSATLSPGDLTYARVAVADVLAHDAKTASAPWENPRTGARGTITPIASAYPMNGGTCRDFLASYLHQGAESWLKGEACRIKMGKWEVKSLRPWKRS
jgi:surface antigen